VTVDEFIEKWEHCPGSERANYAVFLTELAGILGVEAPGPNRDYQIDAPVSGGAAGGGTGFIDLYKRGHFILEAKQSNLCEMPTLPNLEVPPVARGQKYDELMRRAFRQARRYAQSLPEPPWPPFIIILDVGRAFEIYFDYAGNGRDYRFFPDRSSYRIPIRSLRDDFVRDRLRAIWADPRSLDPALVTAEVTRDIAKRLGSVSAWLEETQRLKTGASAADWEHSVALEETSLFLMRILFCMFAEDAQLLSDDPKERPFKAFLKRSLDDDGIFRRGLADLWQKMGQANLDDRWTFAFEHPVKYFNGSLFADTSVFELARAERGELIAAADHEWKNVEPAIFGTLLEQALTTNQRSQLGAHYTPRPYVERIVEATITDVLRSEWEAVETALEGLEPEERLGKLSEFHARLASIVVLDPACGTGNFLYVSMEALLGIEAKVLQAIEDNGGTARSRIGPAQLHGLEKNPRAAKIAELVLWIGWLRWRLKNGAGAIEEPVLAQKANINFGRPGGYDAVLAQDEMGQPILDDPRQPEWPEADFIVGNPPFIGKGAKMRELLGQEYLEALWSANSAIPKSANFVMQWWARAADLLTAEKSRLRRFGFVTTNTISQPLNRRVIESHLKELSIIFAIPDHPWFKGEQSASVRIAMTVCESGKSDGNLERIESEADLDSDSPRLDFSSHYGRISSKLTVGADTTKASKLRANSGIATNGVLLAGRGFVLNRTDLLAFGHEASTSTGIIRPYLAGSELMQASKNRFVIDFTGKSEREAAEIGPKSFQHLMQTVEVARRKVAEEKGTPDAKNYADNWWLFAKSRVEFRAAVATFEKFIATTETTKFRVFQFVDSSTATDHMIVGIALDDYTSFGVLSSKVHLSWTMAMCGMMGVATIAQGHRYTKSEIFDTFPFPTDCPHTSIEEIAKELDFHRKAALAEVAGLTMTDIYNLREKLISGAPMDPEDEEAALAARAGIINRLHDQLDNAVTDAYGWPRDLTPAQIVARLVALNHERAAEEAAGTVRWLRPEYQKKRLAEKRQDQRAHFDS
jgi:hypothetical protein